MAVKFIDHQGKKFAVKEPTIESYVRVMKFKDLLTKEELFIKMICELTELTEEEIKKCDANDVIKVGEVLDNIFNGQTKEIFPTFIHNNVKYKLTDLSKMSFGQFVDIDTFLAKDEAYRIQNLNELAAYFYIKENETYSDSNFDKRIEEFKTLPLKYLDGAVFFLVSLGTISFRSTQIYSSNLLVKKMFKMMVRLQSIGGGIQLFPFYPKTMFGKLMMWCLFPLFFVLTILRLSWTITMNKIRKIKATFKK